MLSNETTERYRTRKRSIELKSSPLFKHYLDDYLAELEIDGVLFKDLRFKGSTIVKKNRYSNVLLLLRSFHYASKPLKTYG